MTIQRTQPPPGHQRQHAILIVDDSETDRYVLHRCLDEVIIDAVVVEEADSAESAIKKLHDHVFDMVFLDIRMPGHNGFYVLDTIRSRKKSSWPIVYMFSSSLHPDDVRQSYDGFATLHVPKPGSLDEMRDTVARCCSLFEVSIAPC